MKKLLEKKSTIIAAAFLCVTTLTAQTSQTLPGTNPSLKNNYITCPQEEQIGWARKNIPDYEQKMKQQETLIQQTIEKIKSQRLKKDWPSRIATLLQARTNQPHSQRLVK